MDDMLLYISLIYRCRPSIDILKMELRSFFYFFRSTNFKHKEIQNYVPEILLVASALTDSRVVIILDYKINNFATTFTIWVTINNNNSEFINW